MRIRVATLMLIAFLTACASQDDSAQPLPTAAAGLMATPQGLSTGESPSFEYAYTYLQPSGNRMMAGLGGLIEPEPIVIGLTGVPTWVAGTPIADGVRWFVVMADGQVQTVTISSEGEMDQAVLSLQLPPGQPPVVDLSAGGLVDWTGLGDISSATHPVVITNGLLAWIAVNGDVVLSDSGGFELDRLPLEALPDARLAVDGDLVAVYIHATDFYDHAILGDGLEGGQIAVLDTAQNTFHLIAQIDPPDGSVFEGISPILVDWNQDGILEILATVSDYQSGSRFMLYGLDGELLAQGQAIGQGYRWRHQIAVAPFEAGGEWLLASVLRPHLDGTVQLHAWRGNDLVEITSLAGYTSHRIGERNLDRAAAADFDGDGRLELLMVDLSLQSLVMLGWSDEGLVEEWRSDLGGEMVTNLGAVEMEDGSLSVAVGTGEGDLVVWSQ